MTLKSPLVVIAGLDPAIQIGGVIVVDRRVKPGDDNGAVQSDRSPS
jgi:hypothetical protein